MQSPALPDQGLTRMRFERAARGPGGESVVAREAARRMAERLPYVKLAPERILDAGCGKGEDLAALRRRYSGAQLVGLDSASAAIRAAKRSQGIRERARSLIWRPASHFVCADLSRLPFASSGFDLVWSNLALPWLARVEDAFKEFHRVLRPGGLLMFCTYGPDSLKELKAAFSAVDSHSHVHSFVDMHDLGDLLVAGGFADPVMDMDLVTLTYQSVDALARDLRQSGQTHSGAGGRRGLMGRDAWARLVSAYENLRRDDRLPATVELVFGHAWRPPDARADGAVPIRFHR